MPSTVPATPPVFTDGTAPTVAQLNALSAVSAYACQSGMDSWKLAGPPSPLAVAKSVQTPIPMATNVYSTPGLWSSGSPTIVTIQTPGIYQMNLALNFASVNSPSLPTGGILIFFMLTGSQAGNLGIRRSSVGAHSGTVMNTTLSMLLAAGDTVAAALEVAVAGTLQGDAAAVGNDYSGVKDSNTCVFGGRLVSLGGS